MPQQPIPEALLRQLDPEQLRRAIRRRLAWLAAGFVIVVVGSQIDVQAHALPSYTPTVAVLVGTLVGGLGLLGLRAGSGCLAQILGVVWLSALMCNTAPRGREPRLVLAGSVVVLSGLALALSRRRKPPGGLSAGFTLGPNGPAGAGPEPAGGGTIIDTEARETGEGGETPGDPGGPSGPGGPPSLPG